MRGVYYSACSLCYKTISQFHQKRLLMRDCLLFRRLLIPESTVPSILSINIQPLCNLCHSLRREESSIFLDNLINLLSAQSLGLLTAKNLFYFDSPNHRFVTIIKTVQFKNTVTRSLFHSKLWPFSVMHQLTSKKKSISVFMVSLLVCHKFDTNLIVCHHRWLFQI